jgi:hypothetical protein
MFDVATGDRFQNRTDQRFLAVLGQEGNALTGVGSGHGMWDRREGCYSK